MSFYFFPGIDNWSLDENGKFTTSFERLTPKIGRFQVRQFFSCQEGDKTCIDQSNYGIQVKDSYLEDCPAEVAKELLEEQRARNYFYSGYANHPLCFSDDS